MSLACKTSSKNGWGRCHRRGGFTLVELLVVIGIIAVLISILLPSLAKARQAAMTLACASNMRQFGNCFVFYSNESKGWTPWTNFPDYPINLNKSWWQHIGTQLGYDFGWRGQPQKTTGWDGWDWPTNPNSRPPLVTNLSIFRCPSNSQQQYVGDGIGYNASSYGEISFSYNVNGCAYDGYLLQKKSSMLEGRFMGVKYSMMKSPSELIAMFDGVAGQTKAYQSASEAGASTRCVPAPEMYSFTGVPYARYVHNGGVNVLYADGHVEWQKGPLAHRGSLSGTPAIDPATGDGDAGYAHYWSNGKAWYARD